MYILYGIVINRLQFFFRNTDNIIYRGFANSLHSTMSFLRIMI